MTVLLIHTAATNLCDRVAGDDRLKAGYLLACLGDLTLLVALGLLWRTSGRPAVRQPAT